VEHVIEEVSWLVRTFAPKRVVFRDPVFAFQRERIVDLCERLVSSGLSMQWECESRPEHFDAELLKMMHRAGCRWVKIGLETTNTEVLADLGRVPTSAAGEHYLQKASQVVQSCRQLGLGCRLFVMTGLPGQSTMSAGDTAKWVSSVRPTALNIKRLEAYPGTIESEASPDVDEQTALLQEAQTGILAAQRPRGFVGRVESRLRSLCHRLLR
jgi:radical SAM superfamily enzyme YgiQ (UPF0313 family)